MKYITITNHEGTVTYQLASFAERLVARIIDSLIIFIPNFIIPVIPSWLYWSLQHSSADQCTVGQRAMGIKLIEGNGKKINFGLATGRFFANYLNVLTFFVGYLIMLSNPKSQCLHDMITNCVVVKSVPVNRTDDIIQHFIE